MSKSIQIYVVGKLEGVSHLSTLVAEFLVQKVAILGKSSYEFIYFPILPLVIQASKWMIADKANIKST